MIDPKQYQNHIEKAQALVDLNCPSPEDDLIRLSKSVADSPKDERHTKLRWLAVEIDDLIAQLRWHLGQTLLLREVYPQIDNAGDDDDPDLKGRGMVTSALLLLRGYVSRPERVLFTDLSEPRRGGTVAGWIFHMMVDDSVGRAISILDRLARVVCLVADESFEKVYFRSKKLSVVHKKLEMPESQKLVELAESEVFEILLSYRDGWTHERKIFARLAGFPPGDSYTDASGQQVRMQDGDWTADVLFSVANAAYHQVL